MLLPGSRTETAQVVVNCYDFFDRIFPESGLLDLTEGMYGGDPSIPYEQAQKNQINWLLDEIGCAKGSRVLDIGCGNGTLLEAARQRGAEAIGITISPAQVQRCRQRGLDARLLNYRDIDEKWTGYFDGIVANGSIEHFVQPADVISGKADAIYQELFEVCHRVINPAAPVKRFVTTTIHTCESSPRIASKDLLKGPLCFRWGSSKFHYALVQKGFGGFYPAIGQLQRCAEPYFRLLQEVDGTQDYHLTSEACFRRVKQSLFRKTTGPSIWRRLFSFMMRHPIQGTILCLGVFLAESWQWQFRGATPPTMLLRQTWQFQTI
jgi:cyclopropane fatty-acyl-phospholipid synthase-like methyltransferase